MIPVLRLSLMTACLGVACAGAPTRPPRDNVASVVPAGEPQGNAAVLRVMAYNIKHGQTNAVCTQPPPTAGQPPSPDCNLDLQASVAVIRSHNPDIVGMQEVDRFSHRLHLRFATIHSSRPSHCQQEARLRSSFERIRIR